MGTIEIINLRDDTVWKKDSFSSNGKTWMDLLYILEAVPITLINGLNVGVRKKKK